MTQFLLSIAISLCSTANEQPSPPPLPYMWLCDCYNSPDDTKFAITIDIPDKKTIAKATEASRKLCKKTLKNEFAFSSCKWFEVKADKDSN